MAPRLGHAVTCWAAAIYAVLLYPQVGAFVPPGPLSRAAAAGRGAAPPPSCRPFVMTRNIVLGATSDLYEQVENMKVTELKEHLRRLNKAVSGTKPVLQERLKEALSEGPAVPVTAVTPKQQVIHEDVDDEEEDDERYEEELNSGAAFSRQPRGGSDFGDFKPATEEEVQLGQEIQGEVLSFSDLGVTVSLDGGYQGLIYAEELDFQSAGSGVRVGDSVTLYVQKVRADGKVDVAFRKYGFFPKLKDARQVVLDALMLAKGGVLPLGDKSEPGEILSRLGISKSQFKAAVGSLYKAGLLSAPEPESIRLLNQEQDDDEEGGSSNTADLLLRGGGGAAASSGVVESWGKKAASKWEVDEEGSDRTEGRGGSFKAAGREDGGSSSFVKQSEGWGETDAGRTAAGEDWEKNRFAETKVFVRGLPFTLTEEDVYHMFGKVGEVLKVRGMVRKDDGRPSGVAWIEFVEEPSAVAAKKVFNGQTFRNRYLEVFTMDEMRQGRT